MKLSIIIPTLNEAFFLGRTLSFLAGIPHETPETIVVDGGSTDHTMEVARKHACHVLTSRRGRGIQQDTGARRATGNVFLFLHADTLLPPVFVPQIEKALAQSTVIVGAFRLSIYPSNAWLRLVAHMANMRSWILKMPYGDQALFMRGSDYFRVGGFADIPIMEDVDLVRRLTHLGRLQVVKGKVQTSSRRWKKEGSLYATVRNWSMIIRYFLGVPPERLGRHYPD
jgi:rSAM/selenodomain-associated transferase 2